MRSKRGGVFSSAGVRREHLREEEAGEADDQHVEHDADDDLVDEVPDRERARARTPTSTPATIAAISPSERAAGDATRRTAAVNAPASSWPSIAMLIDADPLAEHAAERTEDQRDREASEPDEQAGDGDRRARPRPR